MDAAKEHFNKGFPTLTAVFENRPHVVGEHIAAPRNGATCWARTICGCRKSEGFGGAGIAIKFTGEPQHVIDINRDAAAPRSEERRVGKECIRGELQYS